jgi:hypothetical protein
MKTRLTSFSEFLNESWIDSWTSEIETLKIKTKKIQDITSKLDDNVKDKIILELESKILRKYDNDVVIDVIDVLLKGSKLETKRIESLGSLISRSYGTDERMVINAYNDTVYFLRSKLDLKI